MRFTQKGLFSDYHNNINKRNLQGQIAVIVTLVIAVIFLFVMVFINITRISDIKTQTANVSDKGALRTASGLGSLSYKLKQAEDCYLNWEWILGLAALIGGFILGIIMPFTLPASTIMMGWGAVMVGQEINAIMKEGAAIAFPRSMSTYTALREGAIYPMLTSLQADREYVKHQGGYIFKDEITGVTYDLSKSAIVNVIKNKSRIPRFAAWYWAKRYPLISDQSLIEEIAEFVNKLKGITYYSDAEWDASKWEIKSLSFPVDDISVTSTGPSWVIDWDSVKVVGPVAKGETGKAKGFIMEEFIDLVHRLEEKGFDVNFCEKGSIGWKPPWKWFGWDDSDMENVVEEIRGFLALTLELLNMPVSQRLESINLWLSAFYDKDAHGPSGESLDGDLEDDVYERLLFALSYVSNWLGELDRVNRFMANNIRDRIRDDYGTFCEQGRGGLVDGCYTYIEICCCWHWHECRYVVCDGNDCQDWEDARWKGIYGTCTGSGFDHDSHPTCKNGDLYGARPSWCDDLRDPIDCQENDDCDGSGCPELGYCRCCDIPPTNTTMDDSYYFQGQLSWKPVSSSYFDSTSGPTEVDQAIEILRALTTEINALVNDIKAFADKVDTLLTQNEDLKNEAIYAWKDKDEFCHLVKAGIGGYPSLEDFPYLVQTREWLNFLKCLRVKGETEGELEMVASRYSQDMPGGFWKMQYRKNPAFPDFEGFEESKLEAIVKDIQQDGKIDTTRTDVDNLLDNYAIASETKVHFGPEKKEIYLIKTE